MKILFRVVSVIIVTILLLGFSERHFLKRYLSYTGDPLTVPLSWYDPIEKVTGQKDDDLQIASGNILTIKKTALDRGKIAIFLGRSSFFILLINITHLLLFCID